MVVMVLSVYGIYRWKKNSIDPPASLTYVNEHNADLSELIDGMSENSLESTYKDCYYKLDRYKTEKLIDEESYESQVQKFLKKYSPIFISDCYKSFNRSRWNVEPMKHSFMKKRIGELRELGNNADFGFNKDYKNIEIVIEKYDDATKLSRKTDFSNIGETKKREREAKAFLEDTLLRNCSALNESLKKLPEKIRENHLRYLTKSAAQLKCDSIVEFMDFNKEAKKLYGTKIEIYNNYYEDTKDTESIRDYILNKEYTYLKLYMEYAFKTDNFQNYSEYDSVNNKVYVDYLESCIIKDESLKKMNAVLTQKYDSLIRKLDVTYANKKVNDSIFYMLKNANNYIMNTVNTMIK